MKVTAMTPQDVVDACWNYATTINPTERDTIASRIAAHLGNEVDDVTTVLESHRIRVDRLYHDAHGRPSLGSLELADGDVADALAKLPEALDALAQVEEVGA